MIYFDLMINSLANKSALKKAGRKISHLLENLKTTEEKTAFLIALLTPSEIEQLDKRLKIIVLLENNVPYYKISENLKVSSATIAAVNQSFSLSARKVIVEKLENNQTINKITEQLWRRLPGWLKA